MKSLWYAYRDRRNRKRDFRRLWISRINAAARQNGLSYSRLMHGLKAAGIELDRKVLADMAVHDATGFAKLADTARAALYSSGIRNRGSGNRDTNTSPGLVLIGLALACLLLGHFQ